MSKDYSKELNEMYRLMNYGMSESKKTTNGQNGIVEYSQLGADGKTYGILKEGTKYYVKVAPKKDTKILAEDFDYVGGYLNRKSYDSYTKASNALNLQLISINEANGSKKPVQSQYNLNESAEWQTKQTEEARNELNRFYQLVSRVDNLLSENVHYINENGDKTYSEKPTKMKDKCSGPVGKQQELGIKEKDWTKDNSKVDADKDYNNYGVKGNSPSGKYNAANGVEQIDMTQGNPYQEKAKTSKEQGKSVSENRKTIKLSEEQESKIASWRRGFVHSDEEGLVDRSHGTEIGDSAPWTDNVNESFETSEWDEGLPSNAGIGDAKDYDEPFENQDGVRQPVSEGYIFEVELTDDPAKYGDEDIANSANGILNSDLDADDEPIYNHLEQYGEGSDSLGLDDDLLEDLPEDDNEVYDEDPIGGYDDTDVYTEHSENGEDLGAGVGRWTAGTSDMSIDGDDMNNDNNVEPIYEVTLNDFGKHPAYRKKPMTLPKNADGSEWGEDWNDESTKGEMPYGRQIGHSGDPYTDKVDAITNAVVTALVSKKKV